MAIVHDNLNVLQEINGLLDKQNIKRGSISGDRLENDSIGSSQIAAGAVGTSELADYGVTIAKLEGILQRYLGMEGIDSSATYLLGTDIITSANGWLRGGIGFDMYYDAASTTWINTALGSNQWAVVVLDNAGNLAIFGEPNSGNVQRTYTPAQFLTKQIATIDLTNGAYENKVNNFRIRAQDLLTGGGTKVAVLAWGVSWSQRFICIAQGRGATQATSGYFDITMPADGTVITGHGGSANRNMGSVIAGFLKMETWEKLWYELPLGYNSASLAANFHVTNYTSDFDIPDNWVCICTHNNDSGLFYWGDGKVQYANIADNELLSPNNAIWRTIESVTSWLPAATGAGTTWNLVQGAVAVNSAAATSATGSRLFYLNPADYAVGGFNAKLRMLVSLTTGNTSPAGTYTFYLTDVTGMAVSIYQYTANALATPAFVNPAVNTRTVTASSTIAFPAANFYVLRCLNSGVGASPATGLHVQLQTQNS